MDENAAAWGIVAAAAAVQDGQARSLTPEEIARDAHGAAQQAYDLYLRLEQHAAIDDQHAAEHHAGAASEHGAMIVHAPQPGEYDLGTGWDERTSHAGATAIERHAGAPHHGGGHHGFGHHHEGFFDLHDEVDELCPAGMHYEQLPNGALVCRPDVSVGHGHGGHGGHHHGGGGWGGYWYGYDPIILYCGPGQVLLADGTCFPPAQYGYQVGAPEEIPDGAHVLHPDESGEVEFPDGSRIGLTPFIEAHVGQAADNLGGAAGATGQAPSSGNAVADNLNAQWEALAQIVPKVLGPNPTLPVKYAPSVLGSENWVTDYDGWKNYYKGIGTFGWEDITGDLTGWQAAANSWGMFVRDSAPSSSLPANFPTGTAGLASLVPNVNLPSASTIEWVVIAIAVGVGLWLFWPALVGARHLMGSP